MTLIECDECGRQVSDQASECPSCGFPIARKVPSGIPPDDGLVGLLEAMPAPPEIIGKAFIFAGMIAFPLFVGITLVGGQWRYPGAILAMAASLGVAGSWNNMRVVATVDGIEDREAFESRLVPLLNSIKFRLEDRSDRFLAFRVGSRRGILSNHLWVEYEGVSARIAGPRASVSHLRRKWSDRGVPGSLGPQSRLKR